LTNQIKIEGENMVNENILNAGKDFRAFWKKAKGQKYKKQEELWVKHVESKYQDFFDEIVFDKKDRKDWVSYRENRLKKFFKGIPEIYDAMDNEFKLFNKIVEKQIKKFQKFFPKANFDNVDIYAIPSILSFNGKGEILHDKPVLAFGIDMIAYLVKNPTIIPGFYAVHDANVLYSHEIFHVYQNQLISVDFEKIKNQGKLTHSLWFEGCAVYVSGLLNPKASEEALLMDSNLLKKAKGKTKLLAKEFLKDANRKLYNPKDPEYYSRWFNMSSKDKKIPIRGGYYLGLEVVRHIAKTIDINEMVAWDFQKIHEEVVTALKTLAK
jgi:hypothetical protein